MRNLTKTEPPSTIVLNSIKWTKELIRAKRNGTITDTIKYRYRHEDIKTALKNETGAKCVYCESKIGHNTPGDVEHIKPKSKNDRLHFCWHNLTIACTECNRRKNDYDDQANPFLNPYTDDVESCLMHAGPIVFHYSGNTRAEICARILDVNNFEIRRDLIGRKIDKLKEVQNMLDRYTAENDQTLKALLKRDLLRMAEPTQEYSAMVSVFLKNAKL